MTTPRESAYPVVLSTAEFAFMLALLEAPALVGFDNDALLPSDAAVREALLNEGKQQLEDSGKMVWNPERNNYHLDDAMVALLVPVAFPDRVVLCVAQPQPATASSVTYALTEQLIVEVVLHNGQYHMGALESVDILVQRIAETLKAPPEHSEEEELLLPRSIFDAAHNGDTPPEPDGSLPPEAVRILQALRSAVRRVMLSVLQVRQSKAVAVHLLGIVADAQGTMWLMTPEEPEHMRVRRTCRPELVETLRHKLAL